MTRRQGAGRTLPVHTEADLLPLDRQGLDLRDVVADVVEQPHPELPRPHPECSLEGLTGPVHQHLPVRPGVIRRAGHRRKVIPAAGGVQPRAGELPVGQIDSGFAGMFHHPGQRLVADLVAEAPGAAVDHYADLPFFEAVGRGNGCVEDLLDRLDLEKMVPRSERSELVPSPLQRPVADILRIGPRHDPAVLGRLQIGRRSVSLPHGPGRPLGQYLLLLLRR